TRGQAVQLLGVVSHEGPLGEWNDARRNGRAAERDEQSEHRDDERGTRKPLANHLLPPPGWDGTSRLCSLALTRVQSRYGIGGGPIAGRSRRRCSAASGSRPGRKAGSLPSEWTTSPAARSR